MRGIMGDISVLSIHDRVACFHSLHPFLVSGRRDRFDYFDSAEACLKRDKNRTLIMVRSFIKPDRVDIPLMRRLRDKYERIAFFHDDAGGGIPRLEVLPYVDLFYSKALFKDRSLYGRSLYGKELYSDFFHAHHGVVDPEPRERPVETRPEMLSRLRLSWNIGVGDYPRGKLRQRVGVAASMAFGFRITPLFYGRGRLPADPVSANPGTIAVHARIAPASRPSIAYQRKLIMEKIEGNDLFLTGSVSQSVYNQEVARSRIVLSPFGWGELCLRDFEAVLSGSLLLKPDMSHLETWPDVFVPGQTYAPFSWEATDLVETAERYLGDEAERARIARNAYEAYRSQLAQLPERFESIIAEIAG